MVEGESSSSAASSSSIPSKSSSIQPKSPSTHGVSSWSTRAEPSSSASKPPSSTRFNSSETLSRLTEDIRELTRDLAKVRRDHVLPRDSERDAHERAEHGGASEGAEQMEYASSTGMNEGREMEGLEIAMEGLGGQHQSGGEGEALWTRLEGRLEELEERYKEGRSTRER